MGGGKNFPACPRPLLNLGLQRGCGHRSRYPRATRLPPRPGSRALAARVIRGPGDEDRCRPVVGRGALHRRPWTPAVSRWRRPWPGPPPCPGKQQNARTASPTAPGPRAMAGRGLPGAGHGHAAPPGRRNRPPTPRLPQRPPHRSHHRVHRRGTLTTDHPSTPASSTGGSQRPRRWPLHGNITHIRQSLLLRLCHSKKPRTVESARPWEHDRKESDGAKDSNDPDRRPHR